MAVKTAKEIYEAAEAAIYELLVDGKASASFNGRSYTALDIDKLKSVSDFYRDRAIANGEIQADARTQKVSVSYANIPRGPEQW